jgi:hypothetical protein
MTVMTFLAGLGVGFFTRSADSGTAARGHTNAANLAAIEKLHKADIDATVTQYLNALNILWSEGAVKLDVPGSPVVGLWALKEMYEKFRANYPDFKVVKYAPVIAEVQIADGWAIEVGTFEATTGCRRRTNQSA